MADAKKVTVFRAGGTSSAEVEVSPGDNAEQLCTLAAPKLGFPEDGHYQLLGPDGNPIKGDVYKVAKDGDKLTLAQIGKGG